MAVLLEHANLRPRLTRDDRDLWIRMSVRFRSAGTVQCTLTMSFRRDNEELAVWMPDSFAGVFGPGYSCRQP